jgi:hypothetical protein
MKRLFHLIRFAKTFNSSLQKWRIILLKQNISQNLNIRDSEMQRLQRLYFFLDTLYTYQRVLTLFAMSLSFASHENLINNFRTCFQIIVNYFVHIFDISWVFRKKTINLEKSAIKLKKILRSSKQSFDLDHFFLNKCLYHAFTIKKEAILELIRVSMIKMLAKLTINMQSSMIFKLCNSNDESHARNVIVFLEKFTSHSHHLIEIAFSFVMNYQLQIFSIFTSVSSKENDVKECVF